MTLLPGYWTTAEFTGQLGAIGWIQEPRARQWDCTTRWQQMLAYSGPASSVQSAFGIIVGDAQFKPLQFHMQPDGPNIRMRIVYYSDDYEGLYPRDPLLVTWGLNANIGTESVLWSKKTLFALQNCPDLLRRVQIGSLIYENVLNPMTNAFWQTVARPPKDMTSLQNSVFTVCAEKSAGTLMTSVNPVTNATYTPTTTELWYASQLYRLLCKGVTSVPQFQYALRKTSIVFPRNKLWGVTIGTDIKASYWKVGYAFSYNALVASEPQLNDDMQQILDVSSLPRFWWIKTPPTLDQTNDSRWMVTQEFWGVEWFEPYLWPWVTTPGETFDSANGQFDPTVFYDSARAGDPIESGYTLRGEKPAGAYQWPKWMQDAIYGSQAGSQNLG